MTPDEIARLRSLRAAGTQGAWKPMDRECGIQSGQADVIGGSFGRDATRADLDLIAAAVNALPALLGEIERLRTMLIRIGVESDSWSNDGMNPRKGMERIREVLGVEFAHTKVWALKP